MDRKKKRKRGNEKKLEKYILNKTDLSLSDVMCSICLNTMIEPVTMPCNHSLCLQCFTETVSQTSLNCPICRKRISIWVRRYPIYENLVDQDLWSLIKEKFPKKVKSRQENSEDSQEYDLAVSPKISTHGEIRKEYEKELQSVNDELLIMKQKEQDASLKIITEIVEEENIITEKEKQYMNDICKHDLELAKEIRQKQVEEDIERLKGIPKSLLPFSPIARHRVTTLDQFFEKSPHSNNGRTDVLKVTSTPKDSNSKKYIPSKRRTLHLNCEGNNTDEETDNSLLNNALSDIEALNFSGFLEEKDDSCVSQSKASLSLYLSASTDGPSLTKMSMSIESNGEILPNRSELKRYPASNKVSPPLQLEESAMGGMSDVFQQLNMNQEEIKEIIAQQKAFDDRKTQEMNDRRMACRLEKEYKFVNRRKGTENEYGLRVTTPKSSKKTQGNKRNRSLNQSTILESFAKRQKPS